MISWGVRVAISALKVLAVNTAIANAIRGFGSDRVIPKRLLDAFLQTRRGRDWSDTKQEQELFATAAGNGSLWKAGYSVPGVMNLVRREFPDLRKKFPIDSWFVDAMIKQSGERGDFPSGIGKMKTKTENFFLQPLTFTANSW